VGEVLCSVDNGRLELLPNINVQVRIMVRELHGALVIPRAAVREDNGQRYVFVFQGNTVRRRDISVGVASASKYEVLSGLTTADRIAEPADLELMDGMEVRPGEVN
jgi:HlyD family secretion protein